MFHTEILELSYLLSLVEKRYARSVLTSNDFEALSIVIEHEIGETLSSSTLKRMWGYMTMKPVPRASSLDILARYVGYKDFRSFCEDVKCRDGSQSQFVEATVIFPRELTGGDIVKLGWAPNRLLVLSYDGDSMFSVLEAHNSKLHKGDRFETGPLILGYPMYVSNVVRDGTELPPFVAGRDNGLNLLKVEPAN